MDSRLRDMAMQIKQIASDIRALESESERKQSELASHRRVLPAFSIAAINAWADKKWRLEAEIEAIDLKIAGKRREGQRIYFEAKDLEKQQAGQQRWEKTRSSFDNDTGLHQTDFFSGVVGGTNQKRKVHVAINENGDVVYVRDEDGSVLYDKKNNIGRLPHDLNWSRR